MAQRPLRLVVVLSDAERLPGWIARLFRRIGSESAIEICGLLAAAPGPVRRSSRGGLLFQWVHRLELKAGAGRLPGDRDEPEEGWRDLPRIAGKDEAALAALEPDVVIDLSGNYGFGVPPGAARHGVWFTDAVDASPGLAGLRPLIEGQPTSRITLYRRTSQQPMPEAIASAGVNIKFIAARNEVFMAEKSVALILRELRRLVLGLPPLAPTGRVLFVAPAAPTLPRTLGYLFRMSAELVSRASQAICGRLGFRPGMFCINLARGDPVRFRPARAKAVKPAPNCYHADPFLWRNGEETWCFFEAFDYPTGTGHIKAGRLEANELVDIRTVLAPGYHLSFPFLFEHDGELFMMPESCAMRRIELWRCIGFPDRWELHSTALEGTNAADSMLAQIGGQWWLFTNLSEDPFGDMSSELHLFRVDSPMLGGLQPHPLNPVVFDSRRARNAGRVLWRNGARLRPAQDNSHGTYGWGLNLMRIEELSMESYRESVTRSIVPTFRRGIIGCHHIDVLGEGIVFDVRHRLGGWG